MLDNYDLYDIYERKREEAAACFPLCTECKERIFTEKCYIFENDVVCEDCIREYIDKHYGKTVLDLILEEY